MIKKWFLFAFMGGILLGASALAQAPSLNQVAYGIEGDIRVEYPEGWEATAYGFGAISLTSGDTTRYPYPPDYVYASIQYYTPDSWGGDPYEGLVANERSIADYDPQYLIEETTFDGQEGILAVGSFSDSMYGSFIRKLPDGSAVQMTFSLPPNGLEDQRETLTAIFNSVQVDPSGGFEAEFSRELPAGAEPSFVVDTGDVCDSPNGITISGFQSGEFRFYQPIVTEFGRLRGTTSAIPGTTITLQLLNPPAGASNLFLAAQRSGFEFTDYGFVLAEAAPGEALTYTFDNRPANYVIWMENGWSDDLSDSLQLSAICSDQPATNPEILDQFIRPDWPDADILAQGQVPPFTQNFEWPYGKMTLSLPIGWEADYGQNSAGESGPNDTSFFSTIPLNISVGEDWQARMTIYQPAALTANLQISADTLEEVLTQVQRFYFDFYQDGSYQPQPAQPITFNGWNAAQVDVSENGYRTRYIATTINDRTYLFEFYADELAFELLFPTFEAIAASIQFSTQDTAEIDCPGFNLPFTLQIGEQGIILPGDPNNLNSKPARPSLDASSIKVGSIPAGGVFTVLDGPICNHDIAWWYVDYNGVQGWTGEGQGNVYWAGPLGE